MISVSVLAGGLLFGYLVGHSVAVKYYYYKAGKSNETYTKEELMKLSEEELQKLIKEGKVKEVTKEQYEAEIRKQSNK